MIRIWNCAGLVLFMGAAGILIGARSQGIHRALEFIAGLGVLLAALGFIALELLLIWGERSIRGSAPATSETIVHRSIPHLQSAIRTSLQKGHFCRVYKDSLNACWPDLSDGAQLEKIGEFAAQNDWVVSFHALGSLGMVAEFEKPGKDV